MKKKEQKLINTNVITRHKAVDKSRDQQLWRSSFSLIQTYLQIFDKNRWCNNLKSNWKNPRIELTKGEVNLNYTLPNRHNGADLMLLFN